MPLNAKLFSLLQQRLGAVKIVHEGERFSAHYVRDYLTQRLRQVVTNRGEQYAVNCPICNDTRMRLHISHMWGVYDESAENYNYHLVYCFNENCFGLDPAAKEKLVDLVFGYQNRNNRNGVKIYEAEMIIKPEVEARLPGKVIPLHELDFNHHANLYLRQRGYEPEDLSKFLGVTYCVEADPEFRTAADRIIIPVYMGGELKGWQARFIGDRNWKVCRIPKYYTMPGMSTGTSLYNFDLAILSPYVILCEGPADVWSAGPNSVALFGKSLKPRQKQLVSDSWDIVVVLLDGDAKENAENIELCLKDSVTNIVTINLPDGKDPGDFSQQYLEATVNAALKSRKIDVGIGT